MPPPALPRAPPLYSLVEVPAVPGSAQVSYQYMQRYPASNAIDGNPNTVFITWTALRQNQWLSVQVPSGTRIGYIAVFNRNDGEQYRAWLSPYEVWLEVARRDRACNTCAASGSRKTRRSRRALALYDLV